MAAAVQDHLGHGLHAGAAFATRFVIDGLGQAFEVAGLIERAAEPERLHGGAGVQADAAQAGVALAQLFEPGRKQLGLTIALIVGAMLLAGTWLHQATRRADGGAGR